jgi:membrane associated rhomboid family serine protease
MPPQQDGIGFRFRRPTPVVAATLVVLLVAWVAMAIAVRFGGPGGEALYGDLVLNPDLVLRGSHLWGLITGALLHSLGDTDHLVFNGLIFYFFACDLEELWGRARFVFFMLVCALGGDAVVLLTDVLGLGHAPVVGFSGVVLGTLTAWGLTYPDREMFFFLFRLRGIHLVYVTLAMQVLTALSSSPVSAAAHLGGMAAGAAFAAFHSGPLRRWWLRRKLSRLQTESAATHPARARGGLRVIQGGGGDPPKDKRYLN